MNTEDFINEVFLKAKDQGFKDWEIYLVKATSFESHIADNEVREYKNSTLQGISFRGTFKNKMGYAYTEKIEQGVPEILIKNAIENAEIKEEEGEEELFHGSSSYPTVEGIHPSLNNISVSEKINLAKTMEKAALSKDKRIVAVDHCVIAKFEGEILLVNSYGLNLSHKDGNAMAYIVVRAVEGDSTKVGIKIWGSKSFTDFDPYSIANEAVNLAINKLGAKTIPSGTYNIILENKMVANLFSIFINNFYAENVQKGLSLFKDKIGNPIASQVLTIRDNVSHDRSLRATPFDSEGVATKDKLVVLSGVLQTFLYNTKSAKKDGEQSTGNGFKSSFKSTVATDINNLFIEPGITQFKEIIKGFTGVLITDLQGLHAGANSVSGDFSIQAEGFLYENGKIIQPVEQITIAGNFYNMLNSIEAVYDDLYFSPFGQIGAPSLQINGIKISGGV